MFITMQMSHKKFFENQAEEDAEKIYEKNFKSEMQF